MVLFDLLPVNEHSHEQSNAKGDAEGRIWMLAHQFVRVRADDVCGVARSRRRKDVRLSRKDRNGAPRRAVESCGPNSPRITTRPIVREP